ncbi:MAG TPA: hypothetical protein VFU57_09195 [Candidatus Acidoferrales bacterium]|nr:hypothetical protein [Candidatus Acidoferrales bacterium]
MKTTKMMLEYIASCSKTSLESFELARLNDRANLRKQMIEILDELIEVDVQARIAEWVLVERRREQAQRHAGLRRPPQQALRGAVLPNSSGLRELKPKEDEDADHVASMVNHPVIASLREALPDGPLHARQEKSQPAQAKAPAPVPAPAPTVRTSECSVTMKSKRIA